MGSDSCGVNLGQDFHVGSPFRSCQFLHQGHFPESFAVQGTDVGRPGQFFLTSLLNTLECLACGFLVH